MFQNCGDWWYKTLSSKARQPGYLDSKGRRRKSKVQKRKNPHCFHLSFLFGPPKIG
jgi:hypothetical protein